jgi:MtN3 and saliva related transmembrane protein
MTFWTILAGVGVVITSVQLLPQVVKSLRSRRVRDLSLGSCVTMTLAAGIWLAYGAHIRDAAIVSANVLNVTCALILTTLKLLGPKTDTAPNSD